MDGPLLKYYSFLFFRSGNTSVHVQNLLLLLPSIRQADAMIRWFWLKIRQERKIPLKKLMVEMLDVSVDKICMQKLKSKKSWKDLNKKNYKYWICAHPNAKTLLGKFSHYGRQKFNFSPSAWFKNNNNKQLIEKKLRVIHQNM